MFYRSQAIIGSIFALMLCGTSAWSAPYHSRLPAASPNLPVRSTGSTNSVRPFNTASASQRAYYQSAYNSSRAILNYERGVARSAYRYANYLNRSYYPYWYNPYGYYPYSYNPYGYYPAVTTPYTYNPYANYSAPYASGTYSASAYDMSNPYASAMAFGNTAPVSNGNAPSAPIAPQIKQAPSPMAAFGIPNENGEVKWPQAFRLLLPEKQRDTVQKIDAQLQFASTQAIVGKANPLLLKETAKEIGQLRQWLRERQLNLADGTYREATAFLGKLDEALEAMGGS